MRNQATLGNENKASSEVLYMTLEMGVMMWQALFEVGGRQRGPIALPARDVPRLLSEILRAKGKLGLSALAHVVCCFEAGRDGFWLVRELKRHGIEVRLVDSSSIEVPRRLRKAKSDRIDLFKLMALLQRSVRGERKVMSEVRTPPVEAEDMRRLIRHLTRLRRDETRVRNRIASALATEGIVTKIAVKGWAERVAELRRSDGTPLGEHLVLELLQQGEQLALIERQIAACEKKRTELLRRSDSHVVKMVRQLMRLRSIGEESAWVFATELFGWRTFANRRELGASVGLVPCGFQSGESSREQGLTRAGNRRMRAMLIEIAWCWLRYQPDSALARWYRERFAKGGKRARKVGSAALARKLLIALWRYLQDGVVPEGAELKPERPEWEAAPQRARVLAAA